LRSKQPHHSNQIYRASAFILYIPLPRGWHPGQPRFRPYGMFCSE